jgi:catechol 2,3-dioxygenase-like lactoylglutathione lyase family enzyme
VTVADLTIVSHVGLAVPDIAAACADLTTVLGISWAPVATQVVAARAGEREIRVPVSVTWSREGPPYLELLHAADGTPWASGGTRHLHHVAYWVDDVPATTKELSEAGLHVELQGIGPDGGPGDFAYLEQGGLRLELLDRRRERLLARWFAAG